jgi:penicillin-binding protein 2
VAWPLFKFKVQNSKLKVDGKNFLEAPPATTSSEFKDYRQVSIACKTGTAEHGGKQTLPHAWITLFAPAYDPQIVVTVLSEESGEGSNVAAPIAKEILQYYFNE